jgi:hypothetical protein
MQLLELRSYFDVKHFISCSEHPLSSIKYKTLLYQLKAAQDILIYGVGYPKVYFRLWSITGFLYQLQPLSPTPNLEDQGIPFCLGHHLRRVWHGRPYQKLSYRQHTSLDHLTTQAPPLRQSRDTFSEVT